MSASGKNRSSAASVRACIRAIHVAKSGVWFATGKILESVFFQYPDLLLGLGEQALTILPQFAPAFVRRKRFFQTQVTGLHTGDNRLQFLHRFFKTFGLLELNWFK